MPQHVRSGGELYSLHEDLCKMLKVAQERGWETAVGFLTTAINLKPEEMLVLRGLPKKEMPDA